MKKWVNIVVLILSMIILLSSIYLMYHMGVFVDEFNTSPDVVCGGSFGLALDWLRLLFSGVLSLIALISCLAVSRK